jgi:dipeptidyl aminopeptidase/acylaminoacyl peptidase
MWWRRRRVVLAAVAVACGLSAPLYAADDSGAASAGALEKFPDTEPKGVQGMLAQIQQTLFINEQKTIDLQFEMENHCCVHMQFVNYASGRLLIPGYVFTPVKMSRDKRYPAVVVVHGAFHGHFDVQFFPIIRRLVERGYVVMFPEYRGSAGYGPEIYANDYGHTDVADVLAAGGYIASKPFVDGARLGILGRSRGGMLTLLAIERAPKEFKVAVDIAGLADFVAFMGYKPEHTRREVASEKGFGGKLPFYNLPAYMKVSPINYVSEIETPLLVLATTGDRTAPFRLHSGRLIELLQAHHKVFASKVYRDAPGDHVFLQGDTPEAADAYRRIYAWLDRYLQ